MHYLFQKTVPGIRKVDGHSCQPPSAGCTPGSLPASSHTAPPITVLMTWEAGWA